VFDALEGGHGEIGSLLAWDPTHPAQYGYSPLLASLAVMSVSGQTFDRTSAKPAVKEIANGFSH
jgi:hypothetical protein